MPSIMQKQVVFPAPFGPSNPTTSPLLTETETLRTIFLPLKLFSRSLALSV